MIMLKFLKHLDLIFFCLFIISIPFEKRHVFETSLSKSDGHFIEWNSAALYLSDIFLIATLVIWFSKLLLARIDRASQQESKLSAKDEDEKKKVGSEKGRTYRNLLILFTIFIICGLVSTLISGFVKLSFYHLIKLLEFGLLFFYIIKNINTAKKIILTLFCFIGTGFMQAIFGILQYFKQGSFGFKLLGEVDLGPAIQNVAKIDVGGQKFIRAYGTFPHSNVLAGFLFIAIVFTLIFVILSLYQRSISANLRQETTNVPRGTFLSESDNIPVRNRNGYGVPRLASLARDDANTSLFGLNMPILAESLPFFVFILCVLFLALLLTFSRTVWLTLIVSSIFMLGLIFLLLPGFSQSLTKFFRKARLVQLLLFIILILFVLLSLIVFWPQISARSTTLDQYGDVTISGRTLYSQIAFLMIKKDPLLGVGPGLFVAKMADFASTPLFWWQFQPVHNVYLLILAEFGILGFVVFFGFLIYVLSQIRKINLKSSNNSYINQVIFIGLLSTFLGFLIIMFFDHYLWTIQQGALIFWLVLGLLASVINILNAGTEQCPVSEKKG
jgi:hypothetical protein